MKSRDGACMSLQVEYRLLSALIWSRFLGCVDLIGTMYEDEYIATSFGNYVCLPLLRKAGTDLSKEDAKKVL